MSDPRPGHTVLAVPVPGLDAWVRERTRAYDPAWVAADPGFVHAHVTVLAPWLPAPGPRDLARVRALVGAVPAFEARLGDVGVFADGLVHLRPEPAQPFATLTRLVARAYPDHPPYAGRYGASEVLRPHLSLDVVGPGPSPHDRPVTPASVAHDLAGLVPLSTRVDRVDLQWWQEDRCRLLDSFTLGTGEDGPPDGYRRPA